MLGDGGDEGYAVLALTVDQAAGFVDGVLGLG